MPAALAELAVRGGDKLMNGLLSSEFNDHPQTSHTKG